MLRTPSHCLLTPVMSPRDRGCNKSIECNTLSLTFSKCIAAKTAQKQCSSMQMFETAELDNVKAKNLWCATLTAVTKPSSIERHNAGQRLAFCSAWMWQSNSFRRNSPRLLGVLGAVQSAVACTGTSQLLGNAVLNYKT